MELSRKIAVKELLQKEKLLFDGAFGTYYAQLYDTKELPEFANLFHPERVMEIHREYIEAGAQIIRTNTFACNTNSMNASWDKVEECLCQGYRLARQAALTGKTVDSAIPIMVAADIGQIPRSDRQDDLSQEYVKICRTFLDEGADFFVFETFSDLEDIREAIDLIGDNAFIVVQFAMNQFGYSDLGLSAKKMIHQAERTPKVDAVGFNCGVGPAHMQQIIRNLTLSGQKFLTALPNAGYPQIVQNRMIFSQQNIDYFAEKLRDIAADGADILGGCCGTTPEYICRIAETVHLAQPQKVLPTIIPPVQSTPQKNFSFFAGKENKKLIAVELAPPMGSDDEKLMDAAHLLQKSGVDVLTFPDSPSGRTRADSILMAEKVARETGMCVMPHICCRDKNAIAVRSGLLGAYINHIYNFLIVTGDPVPSMTRNTIKSVFNFDSVGLMRMIGELNEDQFSDAPVCFGGAINQSRKNLDVEISRVKKKIEAGASFFLTQPISTAEGVERVRRIKHETGARILCGIMPFVSLRNVTFMKNEMMGIDISEEVLSRYQQDMTREEGEQVGINLAREILNATQDFADGYYFSFPFNRVNMLGKILQ